MAASQLGLYNRALGLIGQRKLASLTEGNEGRRALDDEYDSSIQFCLQQGFWNFAMRSVELAPEASLTPTFGFNHAFQKPDDWIRTYQQSADEFFNVPLLDYRDEGGYLLASFDPLYIRFVSNDTQYGLNLTIWPETFKEYVSAELADRIAFRITQSKDTAAEAKKWVKRKRTDALAKDAMDEPAGRPPQGTWIRSRTVNGGLRTSGRGV